MSHKFKYKDKVRVIKGFYEGQQGEVIDFDLRLVWTYLYRVEIKYSDKDVWINESDLEKVEEPS